MSDANESLVIQFLLQTLEQYQKRLAATIRKADLVNLGRAELQTQKAVIKSLLEEEEKVLANNISFLKKLKSTLALDK